MQQSQAPTPFARLRLEVAGDGIKLSTWWGFAENGGLQDLEVLLPGLCRDYGIYEELKTSL